MLPDCSSNNASSLFWAISEDGEADYPLLKNVGAVVIRDFRLPPLSGVALAALARATEATGLNFLFEIPKSPSLFLSEPTFIIEMIDPVCLKSYTQILLDVVFLACLIACN